MLCIHSDSVTSTLSAVRFDENPLWLCPLRQRNIRIACTQYTFTSLYTVYSTHSGSVTSAVSAVRFDENPFTRQCEKLEDKIKGLKGFRFRILTGRFQVTSWQWRCYDGHRCISYFNASLLQETKSQIKSIHKPHSLWRGRTADRRGSNRGPSAYMYQPCTGFGRSRYAQPAQSWLVKLVRHRVVFLDLLVVIETTSKEMGGGRD